MKRIIFYFTILATVFMFSCTKEGKVGPQGPAGINGTNGTDGNANVHSYTYNGASANWALSAPNYYCDLTVPEITQSIIDNGAVLVYLSNGSGGWLALPFVQWYNGYGHQYNAVISVGAIRIWVSDSDLTQASNPGTVSFKVVVMDGVTLPKNVDPKNYYEVSNYLNIK